MALLTVILAGSEGATRPARVMDLKDYGLTNVFYSRNDSKVGFNEDYEKLVKSSGSRVKHVENVFESLLRIGESNVQEYRTKYIIGAEFNSSSSGVPILNAMFSSTAIHSAPISLNILMNSILKSKSQEKSITAVNHPLPTKEVSVIVQRAIKLHVMIHSMERERECACT
jgi:ATP-binding cassette subfamily A (ABC1) protein 3